MGKNLQRSPEKEKESKDAPLKSNVNMLRSSENALRSEHGADVNAIKEPQQRSERQRLQEPIGRNEFIRSMNSVVQFINEYFDESHKQPVIPEHDVNSSRIHVRVPEKPEEFSEILKDLKEIVVPNNSSPIIESIERIICKWLSTALAIPQMKTHLNELRDPFGTVFYTPRDVFVSVIRHVIEKVEKTNEENSPKAEKERPKLSDYVVYCSDDSQISLEEACNTMKVRLRKVITFDKDLSGMTGANLLKQMEKDKARGLIPLVIIANYGSANVAANDEIWDLVKISRNKKIWLHFDASYAGCEWLDPNCRSNIQ
uniref:NET domain-containing protein n=1 Tax=Caenorhabditis tropicalis TaxID=1561998 RepID=A0A1I7TEK7_9PELO